MTSRKFGCNSTGADVLKDTDLFGKTAVVTGDRSVVPCPPLSVMHGTHACMPPYAMIPGRTGRLRHSGVRNDLSVVSWNPSMDNLAAGGNAGLGRETVRTLAAAGAHVVLTSRSVEGGKQAAEDIAAGGLKGSVSAQQLDLADLASVQAAAEALQRLPRIDYLILNAGVMGTPKSPTKDGFEMQLGTNHIGHFQLVALLLPKLQAQSFPSRVVVVSSKAHLIQRGPLRFDDLHYARRRYIAFGAYGQSKACNILFAIELARRLQGSKVSAFSLHPGTIGTTSIVRHVAPPGSCFGRVTEFLLGLLPNIGDFKSLQQGVATSVYAATAPELEGRSGAYLEDCRVKKPSKTVRDAQVAQRLWQVTEEQIAAATSPAGFKP